MYEVFIGKGYDGHARTSVITTHETVANEISKGGYFRGNPRIM